MDLIDELLLRNQFYSVKRIFLSLSLSDLHTCTHVCSKWRRFILENLVKRLTREESQLWKWIHNPVRVSKMCKKLIRKTENYYFDGDEIVVENCGFFEVFDGCGKWVKSFDFLVEGDFAAEIAVKCILIRQFVFAKDFYIMSYSSDHCLR